MSQEVRVAVLVDCDNAQPAALVHAMRLARKLGRVVIKRGYGNHAALASKWQETLVQQAFVPCTQFQYAAGKNTADMALALDALEALLDRRADCFCVVTSDSDFVYLCRKLQERGALVHVVGEPKTPMALRSACDVFSEWSASPAIPARPHADLATDSARPGDPEAAPLAPVPGPIRRRPKFVVEAVRALIGDIPGGMVTLSELGNRLRQTHPDFSPSACGYQRLSVMVASYDLLRLHQHDSGNYSVGLAQGDDAAGPDPIRRAA
ncbi:NYN domain-containing protein [Massilia niastensis]|uniref:NYN domain-containing protein n=1 Tax=Massilia niastensis TaxID=544911 RepID=UPI00036E9E99|nr:NYN domain-containing protein [Massilia niastensis]